MSQVNRGSLLPRTIVMLTNSASRIVPNLLKGVGRFAHRRSKTLIEMTMNSAYIITINSTFIDTS